MRNKNGTMPETQEEDVVAAQQAVTLSISLSQREYQQLQERAASLNLSIEDLAVVAVRDLLDGPAEDFIRDTDYLLEKNAELYRRLA